MSNSRTVVAFNSGGDKRTHAVAVGVELVEPPRLVRGANSASTTLHESDYVAGFVHTPNIREGRSAIEQPTTVEALPTTTRGPTFYRRYDTTFHDRG